MDHLQGIVFFVIGTVSAQSASSAGQADRIEQLQQQIADAKSNADNAWMLVCSALVLMMTGPGLALFYGGLVRSKNVLSTMMHSFAMMAHHHGALGRGSVQPVLRLRQQLHRGLQPRCS